MAAILKTGLFGGTFNPIHLGHLRTVEEIRESFGLDRVYLMPSARPPHKSDTGLAPSADRMAMARLAVASAPDFSVSDLELNRSGLSYTVDTIIQLKEQLPPDAELSLIVGLDAFLEINTWKAYSSLFELAPVIVMTRPGDWAPDLVALRLQMERFLHECVAPDYVWNAENTCFSAGSYRNVFVGRVTPLDISSSQIRWNVRRGRSIRFLVPDAVADYIQTKGLYR